MSKIIDNALGLSSVPVIYDEAQEALPAVVSEQSDQDVARARNSLYDALENSQSAVEDMIKIAQQSQHPKAYEVLNSAIKTMADISMGIVDLQLKKQRLDKGNPGSGDKEAQTVNNNLFVGSTADLQKMIEGIKNKDNSS